VQVWLDPGAQCPQAHVLILSTSPRPPSSVSLLTLVSSSPPPRGKGVCQQPQATTIGLTVSKVERILFPYQIPQKALAGPVE